MPTPTLLYPCAAQSLEAQRRQLERLEAENKALERDAERFRRRQQLQRSIDDVSKKVGPAAPRAGALALVMHGGTGRHAHSRAWAGLAR